MKKLLAVIIAIVMTFSVAAVSASAAAPDMEEVQGTVDSISGAIVGAKDDVQGVIDSATNIYDGFVNEDYSTMLDDVKSFAMSFFNMVHSIVHSLAAAFDFVCPYDAFVEA